VLDVQLLFEVGYQVANGDKFPEWESDSEFRAKRDSELKTGSERRSKLQRGGFSG